MTTTTFQDRIDVAIERCDGNQTELAKRVSLIVGHTVTPQAISKLANRKLEKPAATSAFTPAIAIATGLSVNWLAHGVGPMDAQPGGDPEVSELFQAASSRLAAGKVAPHLRESLFALLRAIVEYPPGNTGRPLTATEPLDNPYSHAKIPKKREVLG